MSITVSDVTIRLYRFRFYFLINDSISIRFGLDFFVYVIRLKHY